jgi:vancomycin resistance protein VanJ
MSGSDVQHEVPNGPGGSAPAASHLHGKRHFLLWAYRVVGELIGMSAVAVVVITSFWVLALDWYGERHWFLAMMLYAPALTWVLPALVLLPLSVVFCFRYSLLLVVFLGAYFLCFWGYEFPGDQKTDADGNRFTVLSNNVGNDGGTSFDDFAGDFELDAILLQEARPARFYRERYPDWQVHHAGEFGLLTKLKVIESGVLEEPTWGAVPVGARYVIESAQGRRVVLYNIHLPTRRFIISGGGGKGMIAALLGQGGGYGSQVRAQNRDFFAGQIDLVQRLVKRVGEESDPVILAGDFNVPAQGHLYRLLTASLDDAFTVSGAGFGYTFPGKTNNPLAFFQPWLRIDHVFTSDGVTPVRTLVEPDRASQHRAVVAECLLN